MLYLREGHGLFGTASLFDLTFLKSVPIDLTFTEQATGLGQVVRVFGPASRDKGEARG
ncbi:hypothetical protein PY092_08030 [Muricauda sp. 334s03]|uniref:Thioesterase domain-containing protein n=1 Tax=Flagellimonas yonaguniensis TaxID=3031325 RepID=A0ABT5XY25_9FLAO|nr:hypothetical protein [[Muricauda] yonaguniensis]MDF0716089.1 hypothetical protein [[Muricauda] yonaguniensis]